MEFRNAFHIPHPGFEFLSTRHTNPNKEVLQYAPSPTVGPRNCDPTHWLFLYPVRLCQDTVFPIRLLGGRLQRELLGRQWLVLRLFGLFGLLGLLLFGIFVALVLLRFLIVMTALARMFVPPVAARPIA